MALTEITIKVDLLKKKSDDKPLPLENEELAEAFKKYVRFTPLSLYCTITIVKEISNSLLPSILMPHSARTHPFLLEITSGRFSKRDRIWS